MDELNKRVLRIRELMKDMKAELYAIVNPDLVALDEYTKNLYLKMLCTIVQYENEPSEMQVLYLKRIVKGIGVEEPIEEYMRKALDISENDISEFLKFMRENSARYYFALESMLLVALSSSKMEGYEYLAEILELSKINKRDLEYLLLVAKSVLEQDSTYYEEAKKNIPNSCRELIWKPYISNYYVGAIVDNDYVKFYSAPSKESCSDVEIPSSYTSVKVTFQNMVISINDEWRFEGCETVLFDNCDINGGEYSIVFDSCKSVKFNNCKISDFTNYAIIKKSVEVLCFLGCEFSNCVFSYDFNCSDWSSLGGVIHVNNDNLLFLGVGLQNNSCTNIDRCIFIDCGGRTKKYIYRSAVISNDICMVKNSKFVNCWHWNNGDRRDPENDKSILFAEGSLSENNELVGSCRIV